MDRRTYIAIDLKSFYASAECVARGLDPLTTNLVVADASRTEKTICLAVSPSLKPYGIPGRARMCAGWRNRYSMFCVTVCLSACCKFTFGELTEREIVSG